MSRTRRWARRGTGAALAAVLLVTGVAGPPPARAGGAAPRWAQDGYGPGNTGYNPHESRLTAGALGRARLRWAATADPGTEGCAPGSVAPLVVAGRVFVLDGGGVGAYDARTGTRLWRHTAGHLEATGLAVVGDRVLVTDVNCFSNSNYSSNVIALDARTGAPRWDALSSWSTRTFVADAGVVVVSGYCGVCDDAEYGVEAYRVTDGARLWSRTNAVLAGPVSARGRVLLARTDRPASLAVSIRTGATLWRTGRRLTAHAASPAGDRFYLSDRAGLRAVHAGTGAVLWSTRHAGGPLAADHRRVYVATADRLRAHDAASGRPAWSRALVRPGRPVRAGRLLYTVTADGTLVVLSSTDGRPLRSVGSHTGITAHVVVAGGALYTTRGHTVRAYAP
ncbi:MAG TPA: PQQ-binding-like beta-propeller repeat protein [Pilimelia sp.]|nr:PQQ-binding-like beta-propeller repeat protein [Pilimelia sp.]